MIDLERVARLVAGKHARPGDDGYAEEFWPDFEPHARAAALDVTRQIRDALGSLTENIGVEAEATLDGFLTGIEAELERDRP